MVAGVASFCAQIYALSFKAKGLRLITPTVRDAESVPMSANIERSSCSRSSSRVLLTGNKAAALAAMLCSVDVVPAYPITPQTEIVEALSGAISKGDMRAQFIQVESEHSALAACMGASAVGARAYTATSSQGLALMHELLFWSAGARLPIVMINVNRAIAPPWNIWADQLDSVAQRDTGWIQFYCETNQEVLDTTIQAYKISESVLLPSMINMDAFYLSHTWEPVDLPEKDLVTQFLKQPRKRPILDVDHPCSFGALAGPKYYSTFRKSMQMAMQEAIRLTTKVGKDFERMFGRRYAPVEAYQLEGADDVLVASGSIAGTARDVVDALRAEGRRVGLLKMRNLRPFPTDAVRTILTGKSRCAVIDRNISVGNAGVFYTEVKAALYGYSKAPRIMGVIAGLGGQDVKESDLVNVYRVLNRGGPEMLWLGEGR
jgi:pyruvate/2-oxoacid:ferredoxin oxidoreductase alpha subunit